MMDTGVSGKENIHGEKVEILAGLDDPRLGEMLSSHGILTSFPGSGEEIVAQMPVVDMLVPSSLNPFIDAYASALKALEIDVAGSYFVGCLAAMALGQQRLASRYGVAGEFLASNMTVYLLRDSGGYPRVAFVLSDLSLEREPAGEARHDWVRIVLSRLHGETLKPLVESWAIATGLRPGYLWGVMPTRFNYSMEQQEREASCDEELLLRVQSDYQLLKELDRSVFGLPRNPFDVKIRWIEHIGDPGQQMRMKNVCCLYYKTDGGDFCYTCPRSSEAERARRRAEYRAARGG